MRRQNRCKRPTIYCFRHANSNLSFYAITAVGVGYVITIEGARVIEDRQSIIMPDGEVVSKPPG